jgi:hypothetical protein
VNFPGMYDWRMANAILDAEEMHDLHSDAGNTHEMLRWAVVLDTLHEVW